MANDLIDDIIDDLKTYSNNIAKFAAIEVRDQMAKSAHDAIESFYNDYDPKVYYRNFYNFRKNSYKKYYHDSHGTTFTGGIILTPEDMEELYVHDVKSGGAKYSTWGAPAEVVFETVMQGWHGLPEPYNVTDRMKPSPIDMIQKRYDQLCRSTAIITKAEEKAWKLRKY